MTIPARPCASLIRITHDTTTEFEAGRMMVNGGDCTSRALISNPLMHRVGRLFRISTFRTKWNVVLSVSLIRTDDATVMCEQRIM